MRKRILLGVLIAVPAILWAPWHLGPWEQIGPWAYNRIQLGMTEAEVESIIGLPPGIHSSIKPVGGLMSTGNYGFLESQSGIPDHDLPSTESGLASDGKTMITLKQWWGTRYAIRIALDEKGAVAGRYLIKIPLGG